MSKKALLIGINYRGTSSALQGCINDVEHMKEFLQTKGYARSDIVILTDDTEEKPTRENILKELLALILSGSNCLFFHYSGHGSRVRDLSGDEADGMDETLVPIDYHQKGMILDDELRGVLMCLNQGQKLTCVLDCCHSGTGMDLAYSLYERYGGRYLRMVKDKHYEDTRGNCIMLSGCQDTQYSADAYISEESEFQGAMTNSFLKTMEHNPNNYEELVKGVRKVLKDGGYTQIPNLTSGRSLNLQTRLSL